MTKKINKINQDDNLILLTSDVKNIDLKYLSKEEIAYSNHLISEHKKETIAFDRLGRWMLVQVIKEEKVLWPRDDKVMVYQSMQDLLTAIDAGTAPRHIRRGLPDLDFWIGKPTGFGMPRYKMHRSELDATNNPLSTWFTPASEKEEGGADVAESESMCAGFTAEGASLLTAMLGTKEFAYPKPLSLTQALIQQTTKSGDLVVDFFAGSGTTAHAVLAQNAEDGGTRRFILVSSTEATIDEPNKNGFFRNSLVISDWARTSCERGALIE